MPKDIAKRWEEAMEKGALKWKPAVQKATGLWAEKTGEAFGVTVGSKTREAYERGVAEVTPEDFAMAVRGKGEKLVEKAREGLSL